MIDVSLKPCTVCGSSSRATYLFNKEDDGRGDSNISLHRCGACKTVYLSKYDDRYDDTLYEYYKKYQGKKKEDLYNSLTRRSYFKVLERIASHGGGLSILDVGCGKGDFVDAARDAGYDAEGIELAQIAVDIARGYGLPVAKLDFFSPEIRESSKDVVTMFEVIEHLPDPMAFLRRAERVVKPGGLIYLTTPNFNSLERRVLGSHWKAIHREHLSYFTPTTLLHAIQKNTDLETVLVETRNISEQFFDWLRRFGAKTDKNGQGSGSQQSMPVHPVELRAKIEKSAFLRLLKKTANAALNATSSGSTIVILLRRPRKRAS